jgi:hypothetical protein
MTVIKVNSYRKKQRRPPSKKNEGGKPKPEGHEGVPQHQHYRHAKRREDRNQENHEEQHNDVA